ncbi:MAG: cytidylate kinase-like family protein [Desulfarculus sp.]|nr:MAG: cytidylate kinase-like family protein [Desulfarculus sp.]
MEVMSLIAISADSYPQGLDIAQRTAAALGYGLLGRELLAQVAADRGLPQEQLVQALEETPGFFGMRTRRQQELLLHIQAACLERLLADNLVCYGLGAHLYLVGVSHALRVRVLAEPQQRAAELAALRGLPPERAAKLLERQDQERRRWSSQFFQADEMDPAQYDMVLSLGNLEPEKAVEIICDAAGYRKFQAMTYSRKCLQDKALAARVLAKLMPRFPDIRLQASDGTVVAQVQSLKRDQRKKQEAVRELASQVPGVSYVEVQVIRDYFGQAAQSGR